MAEPMTPSPIIPTISGIRFSFERKCRHDAGMTVYGDDAIRRCAKPDPADRRDSERTSRVEEVGHRASGLGDDPCRIPQQRGELRGGVDRGDHRSWGGPVSGLGEMWSCRQPGSEPPRCGRSPMYRARLEDDRRYQGVPASEPDT